MGASRDDRKKFIFITAIDGEFRVKANEGDPGAEKRDKKDKDGKVTGQDWYQIYNNLDGHIDSITIDYNEHIKSDVCKFNMVSADAPDEIWQLQFKLNNQYLSNLCDRLINPSVDFSKEMRFKPYEMAKDNGKLARYLVPYQHSSPVLFDWATKIESVHNAENPDKDSPRWDEKFRSDERALVNWKMDMVDYLKKVITDQIIPKVVPFKEAEASDSFVPPVVNETPAPSQDEFLKEDETDDLPF